MVNGFGQWIKLLSQRRIYTYLLQAISFFSRSCAKQRLQFLIFECVGNKGKSKLKKKWHLAELMDDPPKSQVYPSFVNA